VQEADVIEAVVPIAFIVLVVAIVAFFWFRRVDHDAARQNGAGRDASSPPRARRSADEERKAG
jgi:hypothetical protein